MKYFWRGLVLLVVLFVVVMVVSVVGGMATMMNPQSFAKLDEPSILHLKLEGPIIDGGDLLDNLIKYRDKDNIKGVLIEINSPGGVVGPSQELYREVKRVREEWQKPVAVAGGAVVASGAYYTAVAGERIFVNPGTLMGSIGVIIEFADLSELFKFAKIQPQVIKTGAYKDTGAPHRAMRDDEKQYMQAVIDEVHGQFKDAVATSRNLRAEFVAEWADGRIFPGEKAVKLGFADEVGTVVDARRWIGEKTGLGNTPKLFEPPEPRQPFVKALLEGFSPASKVEAAMREVLRYRMSGQPLAIMPGASGL